MTSRAGSGPQRSCIACRKEGVKDQFFRFVLSPDGAVVPDLESKLPGRGAYTCQSGVCVRNAVARRQFSRAFKGAVVVALDCQSLMTLLQQLMEQRISGYLALANKAGALVSGGEAIERTLRGNRAPRLLVLATDISLSIAEKLSGIAARDNSGSTVLTKERLGLLLGKESDRSAVAVMSDGFAWSLGKEIERYRNYLEEESGR